LKDFEFVTFLFEFIAKKRDDEPMRLGRLILASSLILTLWGDMDLENPTFEEFSMQPPLPSPPPEVPWKNSRTPETRQTFPRRVPPPKPKPEPKPLPDISLPSGRPCPIPTSGGVKCDAAFLIWQSKMWGFEFAGKSFNPTNEGTPMVTLEEKVFVPDFAWRPGFKIDVGYDFGFDGWDLDSRWTFYKGEDTNLKKSFSSQIQPPGIGIVPLWFYPFYNVLSPNQIRYFDGKMSWRHYFNAIDLEIGRCSALTKRLSMRLYGGLKGAWMRQMYRVIYQNGSTIAATVPGTDGMVSFALLESTIAFKNETWGAGPRAGFDSRWRLLWGFSLIADMGFSLLFSKVETRRDQNDLTLNTGVSALQPFHMHMVTGSHQLKPAVEGKLGIDWETCIAARSILGFSIAYEAQYWWAQNELRRNYTHAAPGDMFPMRGDLQMHGLTAEAAYSY
jgi:Legionella pneumophila major outer membrane protein precursor